MTYVYLLTCVGFSLLGYVRMCITRRAVDRTYKPVEFWRIADDDVLSFVLEHYE
jgi:hypothetical protein